MLRNLQSHSGVSQKGYSLLSSLQINLIWSSIVMQFMIDCSVTMISIGNFKITNNSNETTESDKKCVHYNENDVMFNI